MQAGAKGTIYFVNGPSKPPVGKGSAEFSCPDKKFIRFKNNQYVGTVLSAITELSYSTYIKLRDSTVDNIFIALQTDINSDGIWDYSLVFNPQYQTGRFVAGFPDQGPTLMNTWQTWNLLKGGWWLGVPNPNPSNGGGLFTLASFINKYPNATIMNQDPSGPGALRIGGGAPVFAGPFIGNVDNFKIGINGVTTTYDFE